MAEQDPARNRLGPLMDRLSLSAAEMRGGQTVGPSGVARRLLELRDIARDVSDALRGDAAGEAVMLRAYAHLVIAKAEAALTTHMLTLKDQAEDPEAVRSLGRALAEPVEFADAMSMMYRRLGKVDTEAGPRH